MTTTPFSDAELDEVPVHHRTVSHGLGQGQARFSSRFGGDEDYDGHREDGDDIETSFQHQDSIFSNWLDDHQFILS